MTISPATYKVGRADFLAHIINCIGGRTALPKATEVHTSGMGNSLMKASRAGMGGLDSAMALRLWGVISSMPSVAFRDETITRKSYTGSCIGIIGLFNPVRPQTAIIAVRTDVSTVKTTSPGNSTNCPMNARLTQPSGMTFGRSLIFRGMNWLVM